MAADRVRSKQASVAAVPDPIANGAPISPQPPGPAASPAAETRNSMDVEREKASVIIPTLEGMSASVRELASLEGEFQKQCTGVIEVPFVDPYGVRVAGTMNKDATPECLARKTRMTELKQSLARDGSEVQDTARRAGILPGVLRDLVAQYRLGAYLRP
jgi:hypothetical protein